MKITPIYTNQQPATNNQIFFPTSRISWAGKPNKQLMITSQTNFTALTKKLPQKSNPLHAEIFSDIEISKVFDPLPIEAREISDSERVQFVVIFIRNMFNKWFEMFNNANKKEQEFIELFIDDARKILQEEICSKNGPEIQKMVKEIKDCIKAWRGIDIKETHDFYIYRRNL